MRWTQTLLPFDRSLTAIASFPRRKRTRPPLAEEAQETHTQQRQAPRLRYSRRISRGPRRHFTRPNRSPEVVGEGDEVGEVGYAIVVEVAAAPASARSSEV